MQDLKHKPHKRAHAHSDSHAHSHANGHHGHEHHGHENHRFKAILGMLFGFCLLSIPLMGLALPSLANYFLNVTSFFLTIYLGKDIYRTAWQALKNKQITTETLYTISTLTILGLSVFSLFYNTLELMIESAPLVLGFWHLGEAIEHSLIEKINEQSDIRECAPKKVTLKSNPNRPHSVKSLTPGDVIILHRNNVIPVDGILKGPALLYTTRVDGSLYPKMFMAGDAVKAGMTLSGSTSEVEVIVSKSFENSYLSLIAKNIDAAHKEKAPIEVFANRVLKFFVPGLVVVSIISGVALSLIYNPATALQSVISILVSACPCALSLITPMAVRLGMKKASEKGVHFKNGKSLQSAANIDAVVFDLNGTLTEGKPSVTHFSLLDNTLWSSIAALESHSDHPVSKAIREYIAEKALNTNATLKITDIDKSHHAGIKGKINGVQFIIGNLEMLHAHGITEMHTTYKNEKNGNTYVVRGGEVIGQIAITDRLREDASITVQQLQDMGKQVYICTGADKRTAKYYGKQLGIPSTHICANTVGAVTNQNEVSKESFIKQLQNKGYKVAMVGDAANDLAAIARADVGVAVKSAIGDQLTEQHAGMTLHQGLLFPIALAFDIAEKTSRNIYQNLSISLSYNSLITFAGAGFLVPLGFVLSPGLGVGLMVLESAIVLANLYRLKVQKTLYEKKKEVTQQPDMQFSRERMEEVTNAFKNATNLGQTISLANAPGITFSDRSAGDNDLSLRSDVAASPTTRQRV
ncbi:MAG: HAD-IC family P-type ATPase [Gammaproteobacteria bacterium]